jgi:hypothetical protein
MVTNPWIRIEIGLFLMTRPDELQRQAKFVG